MDSVSLYNFSKYTSLGSKFRNPDSGSPEYVPEIVHGKLDCAGLTNLRTTDGERIFEQMLMDPWLHRVDQKGDLAERV